jgi:hypothetical protein
VQSLVGTSKSEFDAWEGYGSQLSFVDADAVAGATVSTGNITSMLKSLFHIMQISITENDIHTVCAPLQPSNSNSTGEP